MGHFTLSEEEIRTAEAYKKLAATRNKTNADPKFWEFLFVEFKRLFPRGRILDIGCGGGRDAQLFVPLRQYQYIGVDTCEEMIKAAKNLVPRGTFLPMNMYFLDFPPASFHGFWAAASLVHIPKKKIHLVLSQIKKVVKPGGIGLFIVEEGKGERMVPGLVPDTDRLFVYYSSEEFRRILKKSGFKVLDMYYDYRERYGGKTNSRVWLPFFVRVL